MLRESGVNIAGVSPVPEQEHRREAVRGDRAGLYPSGHIRAEQTRVRDCSFSGPVSCCVRCLLKAVAGSGDQMAVRISLWLNSFRLRENLNKS